MVALLRLLAMFVGFVEVRGLNSVSVSALVAFTSINCLGFPARLIGLIC